jgi:hypothetical protein
VGTPDAQHGRPHGHGTHLCGILGGSLESIYWEIGTRSVYAIVDMPDSATMAAATAVLTQTGAFKSVDAHELLTQDQLSDVLTVAGDASELYRVPDNRLTPRSSPDSTLALGRHRG